MTELTLASRPFAQDEISSELGPIPPPQRKLRIALSIWSFTPNTGGLQAHAQLLCQHLLRRGHEVHVITRSAARIPVFNDYLFYNEPDSETLIAEVPVRLLQLSHSWAPALWLIQKTIARSASATLGTKLYEIVSSQPMRAATSGFDIIHHIGQATALVGFAAAQAARFHKKPFLIQPTVHPFNAGDSDLDLQLFRKADRLLVHTRFERDYFLSRGFTCPIDIVGNGIEDRADGIGERFRAQFGIQGPIILYLGRKEEDKGYPLVVEAFKRIRSRFPGVKLVCMGPNPYKLPNETCPDILDLDFASEELKHDALAACTCLCVPSIGESFGLVYMEAGRYGKAVIGRDLPVLRELLDNGRGGLLLGKQNPSTNSADLTPDELADGIENLLNNSDTCARLGERCRAISEAFVMDRIVTNFEHSYISSLTSV